MLAMQLFYFPNFVNAYRVWIEGHLSEFFSLEAWLVFVDYADGGFS
jgi:hypothetical protein